MGSGVCEHCGMEFPESTQRRKFCSSRCRGAAWQASRKRELVLALEELGRAMRRLEGFQQTKRKSVGART
jgi:hypothetical protein